MNNNEFKRCPFCAGHASLTDTPLTRGNVAFQIVCDNCGASTRSFINDMGRAATAWNDRVYEEYANDFMESVKSAVFDGVEEALDNLTLSVRRKSEDEQ